jgi:pimeloyl-ACP methyl ester carboxylesterase
MSVGLTEGVRMLVSERVGELTFEGGRLEYTDYGYGGNVVVLLHGQLMLRRMHDPLARRIAGEGYRVVTLDLPGHGRSDRPTEPRRYSMTTFARAVVALLDQLGVDSAFIGGTSLGANVTLEVAVLAPHRVRGMILEMPVLDHAVEAGIVVFAPLLFMGRVTPWLVSLMGRTSRLVPRSIVGFWGGVALDVLDQRPAQMAAVVHGIFFGRIAPSVRLRSMIEAPAIVIGHPHDLIHPAADAAMLAGELPHARFVEALSIVEWRRRPERIDQEVLTFLSDVCARPARRPRSGRPRTGTMDT